VLTFSLVVRKVSLIAISPPLAYKSFRSFPSCSFPTNSIWDLFVRQPVKQIAYKYCVNFAKLNFRTEYSAPAETIVAL